MSLAPGGSFSTASHLDLRTLSPRNAASIKRLLQHKPNQTLSLTCGYPMLKLAAVLVLLYEKAGSLRVLLTTRSRSLRSHPYQTALPGGKVDHGDADMIATAFREANEEVGLPVDSPHVHFLCLLRPFVAQRKLLVTPVVALLTDITVLDTLIPSVDEVDHIFDHPLEAVLDPRLASNGVVAIQEEENWPYTTEFYYTTDMPSIVLGTYRMHRFRSSHTPVKGLTADILITVAEIAYDIKPIYERFAPGQLDSDILINFLLESHLDVDNRARVNLDKSDDATASRAITPT